MIYVLMIFFVAAVTVLDQWTKFLVVQNIPLYGTAEAIPGLFRLTYVQNTGAAFSSFDGMQWLFVLVFVAFTVGLVWEFKTRKLGFKPLEQWLLVAVYAGGLGNMIDRLRLGYVVDMIELEFMNFPVFNVADCFITCGAILLVIHMIFFNKDIWKDEKKK